MILVLFNQGGGILDPQAQLNISEIAGPAGMSAITDVMGSGTTKKKRIKEKEGEGDENKETKEAIGFDLCCFLHNFCNH